MQLRVGIQKSGRLSGETIQLFKDCDIRFPEVGKEKLKLSSTNFPLEVYHFRNSDIPKYLADSYVDVVIVGENTVVESMNKFKKHCDLGFGKTRLSICVSKNSRIKKVTDLNKKIIATSYPNSLKKFLQQKKIKANIHYLAGSVELAPNLGFADAICDLVSTGNTIFNHSLKELEIILHSEAGIFTKTLSKEKKIIFDKLLFRIKSLCQAKNNKYIMMNVSDKNLPEVLELLPGLKSPTVQALSQKSWNSVHTVIREDKFWEILQDLKGAGAQGIIVIPIEKMVV